ncbi:MAG: CHAD domain-containing protein [Acidobacteria bacterium]|nr:CHAD domain-containing protein [Acidobacteriota bacterium]
MNMKTSHDGLWRKRLDALNAVWPDFLAGQTKALHKARVALRRIRAALPVVGAAASPARVKKLQRRMHDLTRFLGPIRELDVELRMLEKEAAKDLVSRPALALVRRDVAARRHALRDRLSEEPPVEDLKRLIRKLERVAEGNQKGGEQRAEGRGQREEGTPAWRAALAATLLRRTTGLKSALEDAGSLYIPERVHDVRIATKKLRYALEIAQDSGQAGAAALVNVLKKEQKRLGHLHDLQALLKHVREAESSPRARGRLADLTAYADLLEGDCRQLHALFVEGRDAMFECAKEVRHAVVPALTTVHFRQARVAPGARRARARSVKSA